MWPSILQVNNSDGKGFMTSLRIQTKLGAELGGTDFPPSSLHYADPLHRWGTGAEVRIATRFQGLKQELWSRGHWKAEEPMLPKKSVSGEGTGK